ncbi:MAG: 30S ribosomal protein S8 [Candidatus Liptonbacteria bacterium RIFCSPLOWO2_01_FULL_56_20]|uniref:Small ribosomal subunit protein uS8 n=1 Tax=Candidatus Liptonbacteria bacterium RIFCSPLOWO2_01_FULL_56_20 TaxID=1798652 RepID=A0A1G2CJM9_9BACT|nr:MAG: 30S ribosomal protein S8 [Parcubacteria group bacterium GW2011_GWB1_56_8]OGY97939.1 MAG: 30S ribosomal protein S8 [Candidatus Liptonbacteria bacterium RIFCSPHIGHO2_01_FULL_56_18b]OGZ01559.1 MAG: 30S ribosomal protein S8 [Candidatus Liptonbacteria bacterium RIFCSPLOWO2_01_FULL_56_20]
MYYDLLVKIKNAERARKEVLHAPLSKLDFSVAKLLVDAGYLQDAQKKPAGKRTVLELKLRYANNRPALSDFKIVSKPSRRIYVGYRDLQMGRGRRGIAVLSTPEGVMSNREARTKKVGGEYLFDVW